MGAAGELPLWYKSGVWVAMAGYISIKKGSLHVMFQFLQGLDSVYYGPL